MIEGLLMCEGIMMCGQADLPAAFVGMLIQHSMAVCATEHPRRDGGGAVILILIKGGCSSMWCVQTSSLNELCSALPLLPPQGMSVPPWRQGRSICSMWMPYTYTDTPVPAAIARVSCPGALPLPSQPPPLQRSRPHPPRIFTPQENEAISAAMALTQSAPQSEWQLPLWPEVLPAAAAAAEAGMLTDTTDRKETTCHTDVKYGFKVVAVPAVPAAAAGGVTGSTKRPAAAPTLPLKYPKPSCYTAQASGF